MRDNATRQAARRAARAGRWAEAATAYRALVRRRTATVRDRVQLGHALKEAGDPAGAGVAYQAAAAAFPHDRDAQFHHGLFLDETGHRMEAIHALARTLVLDPGNAFVHTKLAELGVAEDAQDRAMLDGILAGHDAAPRRPGPIARLILGWQLRGARREARARRWDAAERTYRRMLARDPRNPRLLVQLGHALREQGDNAGGVAAYREALIGGPRQPDTYLHLGHALKALGRREAAVEAYLAAYRLQPGLPAATAELEALGWQKPAAADMGAPPPAAAPRLVMPGGLTRRQQSIWSLLAARVETGS